MADVPDSNEKKTQFDWRTVADGIEIARISVSQTVVLMNHPPMNNPESFLRWVVRVTKEITERIEDGDVRLVQGEKHPEEG